MQSYYQWCVLGGILGLIAAMPVMAQELPHAQASPTPLSHAERKSSLALRWKQKMPGAISSLSAAATGDVLVATNPDPDIVGSSSRFLLTRLNARGQVAWQKVMEDPVKEQDLSADGKMAVISNYGDQLLVFNAQGKLLWQRQGTCKPYFLNRANKILCYHDEDVDSKVAFDLYDFKGKRIVSYGISGDILGFKLAHNQAHFSAGLTRGRVVLFSADGSKKWQKQLPGEVVDVAVSSEAEPKVAVLVRGFMSDQKKVKMGGQSLYLLTAKGEVGKKIDLPIQAFQVEFTPRGDRVIYQGSSPALDQKGQVLGSVFVGKTSVSADWVRGVSPSAVYFHPFVVGRGAIYFGIESSKDQGSGGVSNQLLLVSEAGEPLESIPLVSDEGAFFYAHRVAEGGRTFVAVATDDGRVNGFEKLGNH